jgi:hypothetical protein
MHDCAQLSCRSSQVVFGTSLSPRHPLFYN